MTCKWKAFCEQGDTCVAHEGYDILKCTAFKYKGVPMTNEEWIKSLKTEELAEFLADKCNEVVDTVLSDASCNIDDADQDDYWYRKTDFVEWLKEIHKD